MPPALKIRGFELRNFISQLFGANFFNCEPLSYRTKLICSEKIFVVQKSSVHHSVVLGQSEATHKSVRPPLVTYTPLTGNCFHGSFVETA